MLIGSIWPGFSNSELLRARFSHTDGPTRGLEVLDDGELVGAPISSNGLTVEELPTALAKLLKRRMRVMGMPSGSVRRGCWLDQLTCDPACGLAPVQ